MTVLFEPYATGLSLRTAARLADAAKKGAALLSKGGKVAGDILRYEAQGCLSLNAALDLSDMRAKYTSVASQFELNKPDLLASYKIMLSSQRAYLELVERRREADRLAEPERRTTSEVSSMR